MSLIGVAVAVGVLLVATVAGVAMRRRSGRLVGPPQRRDGAAAETTIGPEDLGTALGDRATLVQFSSAFCHPCIATRHVLGSVAETVPGVRHVEVDAESHLELVRRLRISSTPTTLVLDGRGVERRRATGVPRKHAVLSVLTALDG